MLRIIVSLVFIISVALASGSLVLSSRLRNRYRHEIFSTLMYYQAFIFTFGFYGIWRQVIINAFLPGYISTELLQRFSNIALLLGLPFIVFAWLMLIRFSNEVAGRKNRSLHILWFLLINFSIISLAVYLVYKTNKGISFSMIKGYFIGMNSVFTLIASVLIRYRGRERTVFHDNERKIISVGIFLLMIIQTIPLLLYKDQYELALIFIFTFFAGNTFIPLYLSYGTQHSFFENEGIKSMSFEEFFKNYDISPRESEIIKEICNGLSNKEISEKLFISLQTVKDHTHRIYIKTNVRNRVQLINLLNK